MPEGRPEGDDTPNVADREGAQPALLRALNERVVLDTIRDLRAVSRAEIARRTKLSKPTVSLAIRTLEESGLVHPAGVDGGRPGRAGILYSIVADAALSIGIELATDRITAAIADLDGTTLAEHTAPLKRASASAIYDAVAACARRLLSEAGRSLDSVAAVTVGVPAVIHPESGTLSQPDVLLGRLAGTKPADEIQARLGVATAVYNDVDLAALGEQADGAGVDVDDFVVLWAGSGLGAAIIIDGELRRGHRGGAGEASDIPFLSVASAAGGSTQMSIDVSAAGLIRLCEETAASHPSPTLHPPFDPHVVLDAAADGDPLAVAVREQVARWTAWYAAALASIIDPELIVLAGPLLSHDAFTGPVATMLSTLLADPPLLVSSKLGDRAVVAGALSVARSETLDRAFAARSQTARALL